MRFKKLSKLLKVVHLINRRVWRPSTSVNSPSFHPPGGAQSIAGAEATGRDLLGGRGGDADIAFDPHLLNELRGRGDYDCVPLGDAVAGQGLRADAAE